MSISSRIRKNAGLLLISLIAATLFVSCGKDTDKESPVINIFQPSQGDTIALATGVHIVYSASDNSGLYEVTTKVTNTDGVVLFSNTKDVHDKTYSYDQYYSASGITSVTALVLTINASDHNENNTNKTISFFVKP